MWRHLRSLLSAGPGGIEPLLRRLQAERLAEQRAARQLQAAPVAAAPAMAQPGARGAASDSSRGTQANGSAGSTAGSVSTQAAAGGPAPATGAQTALATGLPPQQPASGSAALPSPASLQEAADSGLHGLLPRGCQPSGPVEVRQLLPGLFLIGDTGLALGSAAAAAAPAVWQHVHAVLHAGLHPLPGVEGEPRPVRGQHAGEQQAGVQLADDSSSSRATGFEPTPAAACRYCWMPVRSSKADRQALQRTLPAVLAFCGGQLRQGRRLLLCCDSEGLDVSVCTAVACLLAFYRLEERACSGGGLTPVWAGGERTAGSAKEQHRQQPAAAAAAADAGVPTARHQQQRFPPAAGAAGFSKLAVRQHLAVVSAHCPSARPTRGSIKQVFNFFLAELDG